MKSIEQLIPKAFETQPSSFGQYIKIATRDDYSAWLNVSLGVQPIARPENPAKLEPVIIAALRLRLYGGSVDCNPFPGFSIATPTSEYWKVRLLVPIALMQEGAYTFLDRYKSQFVPEASAALVQAVEQSKGKLCIGTTMLRELLEQTIANVPLEAGFNPYKSVSFTKT